MSLLPRAVSGGARRSTILLRSMCLAGSLRLRDMQRGGGGVLPVAAISLGGGDWSALLLTFRGVEMVVSGCSA